MGGGIVGIELQRLFEEAHADRGVFRHDRREMRQCAQIEVIGVEAFGPLALRALDLGATKIRLDDSDDARGDLVLQIEHVFERAVELVGPKMRAGLGLDQLGRDAQPAARLAHAALQHIAHAKLAPDLPDIDRLALVGEARIARDHEQPLDPRQIR